LNIDIVINNERKDCKKGTVYVGLLVVGEMNGRDENKGMGLRGFIYTKDIE
jgi:hypothetical protein